MRLKQYLFNSKICGILVLILCLHIPGEEFHNSHTIDNRIFIDPTTILDTLLAPITDKMAREDAERTFENAINTKSIDEINYRDFIRVIFYYRDKKVAPLFRKIAADTTAPVYFRALAVYSLGESGCFDDITLLIRLLHTNNPLFREYIASAIGKLNVSVNIQLISGLLSKEKNVFVSKTLEAASRGCKTKGYNSNSTVLDNNSTLKKILFYPCENPPADTLSASVIDSEIKQLPVGKKCVPPHMQYKVNKKLYDLIEFPVQSFGIKDQWGIHVGDDSGWLFPGLPVHAILDGVVVRIQHEQSWGNLIAIESRHCDSSPVTVYYGHLSSYINVKTGDKVQSGDKIGEIALSFTVDNGGYLAHLHLGIEKAKHSEAQIKGWSFTDERWINPVEFVNGYSSGCSGKSNTSARGGSLIERQSRESKKAR